MNIRVCGAVAAATATLISPGPSPAATVLPGDAPVIAAAYARNDSLQSYTFHVDINMAMRTFPWLHFKMEGNGDYRRGDRYVVHITKKPSFASKMHDIDLSLIDPSMWEDRYRHRQIGEKNGETVFALTPLKKNSDLQSADVALNPVSGADWVDASYTDGMHVHMTISSGNVGGFLLPTALNADVHYPHMFPLSAAASFSSYSITEPPIGPTAPATSPPG